MELNNQLVFFSAPPRTGSNLFSSILNQNPKIHSEGFSPLCEILWDLKETIGRQSVKNLCLASHKDPNNLTTDLFNSVINEYYSAHANKTVIDKSGNWSILGNFEMVRQFIDPNPKVIVMRRNVADIVKSYVSLFMENGYTQDFAEQTVLLSGDSGISRYIAGTMWAQMSKLDNFFFVDYDALVEDTEFVLLQTYDFLGLDYFSHDFNNIENPYIEDQSFVLKGLSVVRSSIGRRKLDVSLSELSMIRIQEMEEMLSLSCKKDPSQDETAKMINFYNASL